LNPVFPPSIADEYDNKVNPKKLRAKRNRLQTCAEKHPGLCATRDAAALPLVLTIHKKALAPWLATVSGKHMYDGIALVAFFSTEEPELVSDVGAAQPVIGPVRVAFLCCMNLSKRRGALCGAKTTLPHVDGPLQFSFESRLQLNDEHELPVVTSFEAAKWVALAFDDDKCWLAREIRYDDKCHEVLGWA